MRILTKIFLLLCTIQISSLASAQVIQSSLENASEKVKSKSNAKKTAIVSGVLGVSSGVLAVATFNKSVSLGHKAYGDGLIGRITNDQAAVNEATQLEQKAKLLEKRSYRVAAFSALSFLTTTASIGVIMRQNNSGDNSNSSAIFDNSDRLNSPDKSSLLAQNVQGSGSTVSNQ